MPISAVLSERIQNRNLKENSTLPSSENLLSLSSLQRYFSSFRLLPLSV